MEAQLRAKGYTLGHFPQSFEYSTLGGWVATRSSGQQSRGYGRIEDLFAGGKLLAPAGELIMPPLPASAAGPDLRQLVLGSEGRLGIITEATMRISPLPERESFNAIFFPNFEAGKTAVRHILQANLPLSMLRLSTSVETETTLALAGHEMLIGTLERLLSMRGVDEDKSMLLLGFSGNRHIVSTARKEAVSLARDQDGIHVGQQFGNQWQKGRFRTPYLRNALWEIGYGVDTLETAVTWNQVDAALHDIETSLQEAMAAFGERLHVFTHLSHMYATGCSIYTTYLFRLSADPDENLDRWTAMKTAASLAIVRHGGTISHQHGVGKDHQPYLEAEKGELGIATLEALARQYDPVGIMNPGTLVR
jgi:alkyldihydroxyacetonephosphate synthase